MDQQSVPPNKAHSSLGLIPPNKARSSLNLIPPNKARSSIGHSGFLHHQTGTTLLGLFF